MGNKEIGKRMNDRKTRERERERVSVEKRNGGRENKELNAITSKPNRTRGESRDQIIKPIYLRWVLLTVASARMRMRREWRSLRIELF